MRDNPLLAVGLTRAGLPPDLRVHAGAEAVIGALTTRRWHLDARLVQDTWDVQVQPPVVSGMALHLNQWYDTRLARVRDGQIVPYGRDGWLRVMPTAVAGMAYCGLSYTGYQQALRTGRVVGAFWADPTQAVADAMGIWPDGPTFDEPAMVVQTRMAPGDGVVDLAGITDVYVGRPYRMKVGRMVLCRTGNDWTEGSRQSPAAWLVWRRVDPGVVVPTLHLYRLGFCVTCERPSRECVNLGGEGSGNFGHAGRPGEVGGSGAGGAPTKHHARLAKLKRVKDRVLEILDAATRDLPGLEDVWSTLGIEDALNVIANLQMDPLHLGGQGSGNFGHAGRPGEVGGSVGDGSEGGALSADERALQDRLVDFKVDRNLTGPESRAISDAIPEAEFTNYVKVPGLTRMHEAMQVTPTRTTNPMEYQAARDALFAKMPVEEVPFDKLTFTQPRINLPRAKSLASVPAQLDKPVQILKTGDRYYVMNGHHRAVGAFVAGRPGLKGRIFDAQAPRLMAVSPVEQEQALLAITTGRGDGERLFDLGGPGSGNFGHAGRPGEVGGSAGEGGGTSEGKTPTTMRDKPSSHYTPHNPEGKDSQAQFKTGKDAAGNSIYTEERTKLHDEVIAQALEGKTPVDKPTFTILGGGPASGKSTLVKAQNIGGENTVMINADDMKEALPEYRERTTDKKIASFAHEESSDMSKRLAQRVGSDGYNGVLDGTGDSSLDKLEKKVNEARASGATVVGRYVSLPTDKAVELAEGRAKHLEAQGKTPRRVPEDYLRETHRNVSAVLPQAIEKGLFDDLELWDTTEHGKAIKVVSAQRTNVTVHDQAAWDRFRAKANEDITRRTGAVQ